MKKILSLILVFSILTSLISVAPVHANVPTQYLYEFHVKTKPGVHTGTDGNVVLGFITYDNSILAHQISGDNGNFNSDTEQRFKHVHGNVPPWRMEKLHVQLHKNDAWEPDFVTLWLPYIDGTQNETQAKKMFITETLVNTTIVQRDISDVTKRKFTDMGGVDSGGGEFYLDAASTGSISKEWDKKVRDQYAPNNSFIQKNSYDIMQYDDEPIIQLQLSDDSVGRDWYTFQQPSKTDNFKLEIDREKLYAAMVAQDKGEIKLTYTVALPAQTTHTESLGGTFAHTASGNSGAKTYLTKKIGGVDYYYKDVTYTFYRSIFDLGNGDISQTATFTHATDNHYLNRELTDVNITIDALTIHKKSMTSEEKTELITNLKATPSLYLGNNKTTKLANLTMTKLLGADGKPNGKL